MSHFYGTIQGNRGRATRCGTRASALRVQAGCWAGGIEVFMYELGGRDYVRITQIKWANGAGVEEVIAEGPVGVPLRRRHKRGRL